MLRHPTFEKCSEDYSFLTFLLPNVLFATAACKVATSDLRKVLRGLQFFNILTSKCAFRHRGVQFFDMWTSKSAPKMTCFAHFNFQMRFSPQRRAIFRHLNLKKVLRTCHVLHIFTSECAFRHSGVQFLISPLTTCLRTRRFNRPTFGLTRHTNHRENTAFRDFSNIWRGCIFFLLTFALLHLLPSDLTACLICFSTVHIVGSLLFKLPSIIAIVVILSLFVIGIVHVYVCICRVISSSPGSLLAFIACTHCSRSSRSPFCREMVIHPQHIRRQNRRAS